jgi:tetratricopeptide (TPR) repeat protein
VEVYNLLVNRGTTRYWQEKYTEAVQDFDEAIRLEPKQFQAYVNLAQVYQDRAQTYAQGKQPAQAAAQLDKAVALLDQAIALKPKLAGLYRNRASVQRQRGNLGDALQDLNTTIQHEDTQSPQLTGDLTERGRILQEQQHLEQAVSDYNAALKREPGYLPAHRYRGTALMELKRNAEAAQDFDVCVAKGKPDSAVYEARALVRVRLLNYVGAVADYSRALELTPKSAYLHARRGWAYIVGEAPRLAVHDFEEALRLDAKSADAFAGRGYARVKLGQIKEAVTDAEAARRLAGTDTRQIYAAARIYAQAVGRLDADARSSGFSSPQTRSWYQDRAVQLIGEALGSLPAKERAAFWRENIQGDNALVPIGRSPEFVRLAAPYAGQPK